MSKKVWAPRPSRPAKAKIPDALKAEVQARSNELVNTVLKPKYVVPPPQDTSFNYIVDLSTTWYRSYFYFCATYRCPAPNCISEFFETRFARLEYAGGERFKLSFMRYTGQWIEIHTGITLDECLASIKDDPFFMP